MFAVILSPCFNTQPPEGGWFRHDRVVCFAILFQHTAARRRLDRRRRHRGGSIRFQHTAARRRLVGRFRCLSLLILVSTHSRPKAAGCGFTRRYADTSCFNTQPPEGGWLIGGSMLYLINTFQHTAARRRLVKPRRHFLFLCQVSTHSRPKAAGLFGLYLNRDKAVSTHSRPKAAGHRPKPRQCAGSVSTHSRPKAAG